MESIKRCTRCIMDNSSDDTISFDHNGFCNYCTEALAIKDTVYFPNSQGLQKIEEMVKEIKSNAKDSKYDCIMGISGGLDSSYLAYLGSKWGLRILAVHVDDGFDTPISKRNISKLITATGIELEIIKPDPEQFYSLTKAYMRAGVPNLAIPQDNVLFASIYSFVKKNKIKYFLSGSNFALECILQRGNTYSCYDLVNLHDIHRRFGEKAIDKLKLISRWGMLYDKHVLKLKTLTPLNYIDYNKKRAFQELKQFCGFEYYGRKHLENVLTAFIQLYWFPKKFGVDKRTSHLSSMIVSGQMSRDEALAEYNEPLYDQQQMEEYCTCIKNKLEVDDDEFNALLNSPVRQHNYYKCDTLFDKLMKIKKML